MIRVVWLCGTCTLPVTFTITLNGIPLHIRAHMVQHR